MKINPSSKLNIQFHNSELNSSPILSSQSDVPQEIIIELVFLTLITTLKNMDDTHMPFYSKFELTYRQYKNEQIE